MTARLTAWTFTVTRQGEERATTWYAPTLAVALTYARAWAKAHGWTLDEEREA